jgi:hypothetical protein
MNEGIPLRSPAKASLGRCVIVDITACLFIADAQNNRAREEPE